MTRTRCLFDGVAFLVIFMFFAMALGVRAQSADGVCEVFDDSSISYHVEEELPPEAYSTFIKPGEESASEPTLEEMHDPPNYDWCWRVVNTCSVLTECFTYYTSVLAPVKANPLYHLSGAGAGYCGVKPCWGGLCPCGLPVVQTICDSGG